MLSLDMTFPKLAPNLAPANKQVVLSVPSASISASISVPAASILVGFLQVSITFYFFPAADLGLHQEALYPKRLTWEVEPVGESINLGDTSD